MQRDSIPDLKKCVIRCEEERQLCKCNNCDCCFPESVHYTTKETPAVTSGVIEEGMPLEDILRLKGGKSWTKRNQCLSPIRVHNTIIP